MAPRSRHLAAAAAVRQAGVGLAVILALLAFLLISMPCPGGVASDPAACATVLVARTDQLGELFLALGGVASIGLAGSSATSTSSAQRHAGAREPSSSEGA